MKQSAARMVGRLVVIQFGLLIFSVGLVALLRAMVAADLLCDRATVGLAFGTLAILVAAVAVSLIAGGRATTMAERLSARAIPAALFFLVAAFVSASYADVSVSLRALSRGGDDGASTVVAVGPDGHDVRLSGELTEGAAEKLEAVLESHPRIERIHLTSEGGMVDEGQALHDVIAAHKLVTFVPDYCVSACTLAFMGGRERLAMKGARLGFHAPYEEGVFGQTFDGDKDAERAAYVSAGVASDFVDEAMKVQPSEIWTPDADRLAKAHVTTAFVDRYTFPDSNLDGDATLDGARRTILRNFPLAQALHAWKPRTVDTIAAWYLNAYEHGQSEGTAVDGLRSLIGGAAAIALVRADDETLVTFGRFLDAAMEAADSDAACVAIGTHADLLEAEAALDGTDEKADAAAQALLSKALHTADGTRPAPRNTGAAPTATVDPAVDEDHRCDDLRSRFAGLRRMSHRDAASFVRALAERRQAASPLALMVVDGPR